MGSTTVGPSAADPKLELYKTEYELTAARYENIFKAVWQNFSYMSAISGAVLAFGGDRLQPHFLWFIVCLPLVFWYWATYEPLNRYGDKAEDRLGKIETKLNSDYSVEMGHFLAFGIRKGKEWLRVRYVVRLFFIPLTFVFLYNACFTAKALCEGGSVTREPKTEVKIITVSPDELGKLLSNKGEKTPEKEPPPATRPKN
jgi:hypothetical protein